MSKTATAPATKKLGRASNAPKPKGPTGTVPMPTPGRIALLAPGEYTLGIQTRQSPLDPAEVRSLAVSISEFGQKVPVYMTETTDDAGNPTLPALDAGFNREAAVRLIREGFEYTDEMGFPRTPQDANRLLLCYITPPASDYQREVAGVIENRHLPVTDVQEARMHERFRVKYNKKNPDIMEIYGYTNDNRIRALQNLLECDTAVIEAVDAGRLSVQAALTTAGAKPAVVKQVLAAAAEGKVTAREVADIRAEGRSEGDPEPEVTTPTRASKARKAAEAATATDTTIIVPRNASALKKFIAENVLSEEDKDSFPESVQALAEAILTYLRGEKGDRALLNKWEAVK